MLALNASHLDELTFEAWRAMGDNRSLSRTEASELEEKNVLGAGALPGATLRYRIELLRSPSGVSSFLELPSVHQPKVLPYVVRSITDRA